MIEYPEEGILSKELFKTDTDNVSLFCMASGSAMEDHTSTKAGTVHVLEGKGVFNLEGKEMEMKPGVVIFMEKNAIHNLKAEENLSFLLTLHA
jgi:nitric oxide dioxygenase